MKKFIGIFFLLICSCNFFHKENKKEILAVTAFDIQNGIQLTSEAIKTLGLKTEEAHAEWLSRSAFTIPSETLVYYKDQIGVYRLRKSWFKLVPVTVLEDNNKVARIQLQEFEHGDHLVIFGASFLRIAELDTQ